jgi:uncharacterized protein YktA (UPF0223 family)
MYKSIGLKSEQHQKLKKLTKVTGLKLIELMDEIINYYEQNAMTDNKLEEMYADYKKIETYREEYKKIKERYKNG